MPATQARYQPDAERLRAHGGAAGLHQWHAVWWRHRKCWLRTVSSSFVLNRMAAASTVCSSFVSSPRYSPCRQQGCGHRVGSADPAS